MSNTNPVATVPVLVALAVVSQLLPSSNSAQASISVVVTDSTGVAQPAVALTGDETPTPFAFQTNVAPGAGQVVATALDTNGNPIGQPLTSAFSITPQATFNSPTGITVTPVTNTVAAAAAHTAAAK